MRIKIFLVFFLLFCVFFYSAQPLLFSQESKAPPKKDNDAAENTDDTEKVKAKKTWEHIVNLPGTILHIPFWLTATVIKSISTVIQKNKIVHEISDFLISDDGKRAAHPTYDSQVGAGLRFFQKDLFSQGSELDIVSRLGPHWRQFHRIRLRNLRLSPTFSSNFMAYYKFLSDEPFFGIGNDTELSEESNFAHRQTVFRTSLTADLNKTLSLHTALGYDHNNILKGRDSEIISTTELPQEERNRIPALNDIVDIFSFQFNFQYDSRNRLGNPSSGWEIFLGGGIFQDLKSRKYGFWKASTDIKTYVHLFYDRSFVLRTAVEVNRPFGDQQVPFYYFSQLGRRETIRGFQRGRFRDRDMILGSIEYRFPLLKRTGRTFNFDGVFFVDAGQVSPNVFTDFSTNNFHVGYGGGIRFFGPKGTFLQMYLAKSTDGYYFYLVLN